MNDDDLGHNLDISMSRDVKGNVTVRFSICHFLLVVHWIRPSSNRFQDSQPQQNVNERTNKQTNNQTTDRNNS